MGSSSSGPLTLTPEQLIEALSGSAECALIDVREQADYAGGHILFATNIALSSLLENAARKLPRLETRVIFCDACGLADGFAARAAKLLREAGYSSVSLLEGGTEAWKTAGFPLFTGTNVPSKSFGEVIDDAGESPSMLPQELCDLRDSGDDVVLVDCRTKAEFEYSSIPGAINLPGVDVVQLRDLSPQSGESSIVVYCGGRTRGILGAASLNRIGFDKPVRWLQDGLIGWELSAKDVVVGASSEIETNESTHDNQTDKLPFPQSHFELDSRELEDVRCLGNRHRTVYRFDIRSREEFLNGTIDGATHVPGGQLILKSDDHIVVRRALVLCIDPNYSRAALCVYWLRRLGYENAFVFCPRQEDLKPFREPLTSINNLGVDVISVSALQETLRNNQKPLLLDVSSSRNYTSKHIPSAVWITRSRVLEYLQSIPSDRLAVLISYDGQYEIESLVAELRADSGYRLCVLEGGTLAWEEAGLQIETGMQFPAHDVDDCLLPPNIEQPDRDRIMREYIEWELQLPSQVTLDPLWLKLVPISS